MGSEITSQGRRLGDNCGSAVGFGIAKTGINETLHPGLSSFSTTHPYGRTVKVPVGTKSNNL